MVMLVVSLCAALWACPCVSDSVGGGRRRRRSTTKEFELVWSTGRVNHEHRAVCGAVIEPAALVEVGSESGLRRNVGEALGNGVVPGEWRKHGECGAGP